MPGRSLAKVVSGGQTGVDRAALDAALETGLEVGGWCPRGRRAEDGTIPERYPLRETPEEAYEQRTAWNVRDSDATLIVAPGELEGGTLYTLRCAEEQARPVRVVGPGEDLTQALDEWIEKNSVVVLNVAGPRESGSPGIYLAARVRLSIFFSRFSSNR